MDDERADRGRESPRSRAPPARHDAVLIEKALDQQDRADGDEDVLAEEERDVVRRRGSARGSGIASAAANSPYRFSAAASAIGAIERTHHLRVSAERGQAERGRDLPYGEIGEQDA